MFRLLAKLVSVAGRTALFLAVCLLIPLGCGKGQIETAAPASAAEAGPTLDIVEPRVQLMPGMGAVYLRVVNSGASSDRLLAVETPIAEVTEAHESVDEDGVMRMVPHPNGFEVPAGSSVDLAPGGKHVMLIDPRDLEEGETTVPLTLRFETSGTIEVVAEAVTLGMEADETHEGMHGEAEHDAAHGESKH